MSEWWTYRPSDFLMFSPATYRRLFELYNEAWWPLQLVPLLAGMALFALLLRGGAAPGRLVVALLAVCWAWVGWAFHLQRYAEISLAAAWFAFAFGVESLLLAGLAITGGVRVAVGSRWSDRFALALLLLALFFPLVGLASGRALLQSEFFGFAPDPTVIGTLAFLAIAEGRLVWLAHVVPLASCLVSGMTLWTMDDPAAAALAVAVVLSLSTLAMGHRERS